ncbi:MAG TPA: PH domain-containing protein [Nocardioides sp.]|nr:PH domain-containing protein [Nocardioides sp.]
MSSHPSPLPLPHTWRPLGPRIAGGVAAGVLVVMAVALWFTFDEETRDAITPFQRGTVIALGLAMLAVLFALIRSRVVAEPDRLTVVNGYRRRDFEWAEVIAVHLPPGAPWVTLDLADGNTVPAMGIQSSDGPRARVAVRELRALVDHPPRTQ